jgi:MscS family membrane protein
MKTSFVSFPLWLTLVFAAPAICAQQQSTEPGAATADATVVEEQATGDALNRGTPRGSIRGFILACEAFEFERASEYMDLEGLPGDVENLGGAELARRFYQVLSRAVRFDNYSLSERPDGLQGDSLPRDRDELVRIPTDDGEQTLWMQRVPRADGELIWKISNTSVALIPGLYEVYSYPPAVERIRAWFPVGLSFLGVEAFKWFIGLVLSLLAWPLLHLLGIALSRVFSKPGNSSYPLVRKIMTRPMVALGVLFVLGATLNQLGMGAVAQKVSEAKTLLTIVVVWALWSVANLFRNHQAEKLAAKGREGAARLMRPMMTFVKILVLLMGVLFWLNNIGVNITTVLAGLGVGGLAVALALQRPLEDLMGALTIFSQAPLRVGDFVRYGDVYGAVEDIGLRTTRLRTLTNSVVSVPNALIAHREVENLSYRTKIRYWPTLRLRYDTSPGQLRQITTGIAAMLAQQERVHAEPVRVRVTDFADDAILIKVHCFIDTTDVAESLEIGEALNLHIMEIVQSAGARFALPGRSIQLEGDAAAVSR